MCQNKHGNHPIQWSNLHKVTETQNRGGLFCDLEFSAILESLLMMVKTKANLFSTFSLEGDQLENEKNNNRKQCEKSTENEYHF